MESRGFVVSSPTVWGRIMNEVSEKISRELAVANVDEEGLRILKEQVIKILDEIVSEKHGLVDKKTQDWDKSLALAKDPEKMEREKVEELVQILSGEKDLAHLVKARLKKVH